MSKKNTSQKNRPVDPDIDHREGPITEEDRYNRSRAEFLATTGASVVERGSSNEPWFYRNRPQEPIRVPKDRISDYPKTVSQGWKKGYLLRSSDLRVNGEVFCRIGRLGEALTYIPVSHEGFYIVREEAKDRTSYIPSALVTAVVLDGQ